MIHCDTSTYKDKYEKQKACKNCCFPDFDMDFNLKELYLLSKNETRCWVFAVEENVKTYQ
jgi:hypothetical protein